MMSRKVDESKLQHLSTRGQASLANGKSALQWTLHSPAVHLWSWTQVILCLKHTVNLLNKLVETAVIFCVKSAFLDPLTVTPITKCTF